MQCEQFSSMKLHHWVIWSGDQTLYDFQIAFLFAATGRIPIAPTNEMSNPIRVAVILPPTLAVACRPNNTTSQPITTVPSPTSFNNAGCAPSGTFPSAGLILRKTASATAITTSPTTRASFPAPEATYASP